MYESKKQQCKLFVNEKLDKGVFGHFSNEVVCLIFDCARATFSLFLISSLTLRRIESCLGAFFESLETFFQTRNKSRYHC